MFRYVAGVRRSSRLDVLQVLLGTSEEPVDGATLMESLHALGRPIPADRLLTMLLGLEEAGHVRIDREGGYAFALTAAGEAAAYELGPGNARELIVVMVDLVGFVAFTQAHGDDAGRRASLDLAAIAREELVGCGGRVVKNLGDGMLGWLPVGVDPVRPLGAIAARCEQPGGRPWKLRASARCGRPIQHAGDLFGADVNLAARLCAAAGPGQLVLSGFAPTGADQALSVRGLVEAVSVVRVSIP